MSKTIYIRKPGLLLLATALLIALIVPILPVSAERIEHDYGYTKITDTTNGGNWGSDTITDAGGNVYVSGNFNGTVDFDPGAGSDNRTSAGSYDAYLTKYNPDGSYGWTKAWGGTNYDAANSLAADAGGNVYVASYFDSATADFDPGAGEDIKTSDGSGDMALSSFTPEGDYLGVLTWGGPDYDEIYGMAIDSNDNIYTTGYAGAGPIDFNPYAGEDLQATSGNGDMFLTKLSATHYQNAAVGSGLKVTDPSTGADLSDTETGGVERSGSVALRLSTDSGIPLADFTADMTTDRDWSGVTAGSDPAAAKSFVHGLTSAAGVSSIYSLYIPKLAGHDSVSICPEATSLAEVGADCNNLRTYTEADDNVQVVTIDNQPYWLVSGLTGTGGFGAVAPALADTGSNAAIMAALAIGLIGLSGVTVTVIFTRR